jgi:CubicO group peptidase (beta-lactamase class C family)
MSAKSQSRRDVLRKAAAISAAASFGGIGTTGAIAATEAARSAAQRNLDLVLRQATESRDIAGVVAAAVAQDGILYEGAFGKRDLVKGTDMTLDSVFWIASMTKAITSSAAMQLVEQGAAAA